MKPIRFDLHNWAQFENCSHEHHPGITVVTASNGRGKTNKYDLGEFFSMTGIIPGSKTKADMVTWGHKSGSSRRVFEDNNGVEYTLLWGFPGSKSSLAWEDAAGPHDLTKVVDITEKLEQIYGMPLRMMREVCFVGQGEFMSVVSNSTARKDYFNRITDTKRFSDIRSVLVRGISKLPAAVCRSTDILTTEEELQVADRARLAAEKAVAAAVAARKELAVNHAGALRVQGLPLEGSQDAERVDRATRLAKHQATQPTPGQEPVKPALSEEEVSAYEKYVLKMAAAQAVVTKLEIEIRQTSETKPKVPELSGPEEELEEICSMQGAAVKSKQRGKCLLCEGKLLDGFSPEEFAASAAVARTELRTYRDAKTKAAQWESARRTLKSRLETAKTELVEAEKDPPDEIDIIGVRAAWRTYQSNHGAWVQKTTALREWERTESRLKISLEACTDGKTATAEEKDWASKVFAACEKLDIEVLEKTQVERGARELCVTLKANAFAFRKEQEQFAKVNGVKQILSGAAEFLLPNRFPRVVMAPFRDPYNQCLSHRLSGFGADYTIRMTPDWDFEFDRGSGWRDAARFMSGGQKVLLAMCSFLATLDVIMPQVPMLTMDEPTDSLDYERRAGLVKALRELNARDKGLYITIITHDDMLKEAADWEVEL